MERRDVPMVEDGPTHEPTDAELNDLISMDMMNATDADTTGPSNVAGYPHPDTQNPNEEILGDDDGGDYRAGTVDPLGTDRAPSSGSTALIPDDREGNR